MTRQQRSLVSTTISTPTKQPSWLRIASNQTDIAIVGGGFCGLTILVRLLSALPGCRFLVVERQPRPGPGIA